MSLQDLDPRSLKRKRQLTGSSDKGEESGGLDPMDLDIGKSSAPAYGVSSQGQDLAATCKRSSGQHPNSAAADETQQIWKPAASAETKLALHRVKESPNAYSPLRSIAEGLCLILESCEVRLPLLPTSCTTLTVVLANGGERASHRLVGAAGRNTF